MAVLLLPAVAEAAPDVRSEKLPPQIAAMLESGDVVLSGRARGGASVRGVERPGDIAAGEALTLGSLSLLVTKGVSLNALSHTMRVWAYRSEMRLAMQSAGGDDSDSEGGFLQALKSLNEKYGLEGGDVEAQTEQFADQVGKGNSSKAADKFVAQMTPALKSESDSDFGENLFTVWNAQQQMDDDDTPGAPKMPAGLAVVIEGDEADGLDDVVPAVQMGELLRNADFAEGLKHWDADNAFVTDSFGPIGPPDGSNGSFAIAHTGVDWLNNKGSLEQGVMVNMSRVGTLSMIYNFVTMEYPTWLGSMYDDTFDLRLSGPSGELLVHFGSSLNQDSFKTVKDIPADVLVGWVSQDGGQTGWRPFATTGLLLKQGLYRVRFEVRDVGDDIVDSALLIDKVSLR